MKKKKILIAECNVTGEWWAFNKLDDLINHFHWYYKTTSLFDREMGTYSINDIIHDLKEYGDTEIHADIKKPENIYLYVKMITLQ